MKRNKLIKWVRHINLWLFKKGSFSHKLNILISEDRRNYLKNRKCINCKYYHSYDLGLSSGKCKFNPPIYDPNVKRFMFPDTLAGDWCGQFKGKAK